MKSIELAEFDAAARLVYAAMAPTPQYSWPLLNKRAGHEVWVKHENHTPVGSFKVRGGLVRIAALKRQNPDARGVVSATRGNHGQSLAFACARAGLECVIVVPYGNSTDKNASMRALGAQLIEHGRDFDEARVYASDVSAQCGFEFIGPFDRDLVTGVGTYGIELFRAVRELDVVYVPIGCGSGVCGLINARDAMGLKTRIVGVVSTGANSYAQSFRAKRPIETKTADTLADGMAVRVPIPTALDIILRGAADVVEVSDDEIAATIRIYYADTHNIAEGAGAAPLAALLKSDPLQTTRAGVVLCGANIDRSVFLRVMNASA
jgi:threonine dehydratase